VIDLLASAASAGVAIVTALATAVAAGAALWSAWQSRRAAETSERTADAAMEALSAVRRPTIELELRGTEGLIWAVDEPAADVTVVWLSGSEQRGPTDHLSYLPRAVSLDPKMAFTSVTAKGQYDIPILEIDRAIIECSDAARIGRWRFIMRKPDPNSFRWFRERTEYLGRAH
jgi:hypothetical protein